jgi:predicted transcriptional regulator
LYLVAEELKFLEELDMSFKQRVLERVSSLPDDASSECVLEEVETAISIETSLNEIDRGEVVSNDEILEMMNKWVTKSNGRLLPAEN